MDFIQHRFEVFVHIYLTLVRKQKKKKKRFLNVNKSAKLKCTNVHKDAYNIHVKYSLLYAS